MQSFKIAASNKNCHLYEVSFRRCSWNSHLMSKVMEHRSCLKAGFLEVAIEINCKGMQEEF